MTTSRQDLDPHRPLPTDDDLQDLLGGLLEGALRRQLWFVFLDAENRITGPLMPMDDYPHYPDQACITPDRGPMTMIEVLALRLRTICEMVDAETTVLVWERCGTDAVTPDDRLWAHAAATEMRKNGPNLRAQLLLHDAGVRLLTPDDYV